jgi:hypothetical protein
MVSCPVIILRLESTIGGEIWYLKPFYTESFTFQLILKVILTAPKTYVLVKKNNYYGLINYEVLNFCLFEWQQS